MTWSYYYTYLLTAYLVINFTYKHGIYSDTVAKSLALSQSFTLYWQPLGTIHFEQWYKAVDL